MADLSDLTAALPPAAQAYLENRRLDEVECIIADLPGIARGKAVPATKFARQQYFHLPDSIFYQTITGDWGEAAGEEGFIERDMILRSAENIYPVEIENRLEAHPGVREAAVVGVDHPEHGQEVKAVVVTEPGRSPTEDELGAWCRGALASFKVPTIWELREEALPRNASGKVLKTVLSGAAEPVAESMGS